jgi:undecaprenyl diphosphate synthase
VAIIGDGNRRWARTRGKPEAEGHLASVAPLRQLVEAWRRLGISHLTYWWSSADNLRRRDPQELQVLFRAYHDFFQGFDGRALGVELCAFGRFRELLPSETVAVVDQAIAKSAKGTGKVLSFLLGYNGDEEMLDLIDRVRREAPSEPLDEALVARYLMTGCLPAVDLVVRTGGDPHLSTGFMMWQTRYAQLWFTDVLWPDFSRKDWEEALVAYATARRRMGA